MRKFCSSLSNNPFLTVLNLGSNKLGNIGFTLLGDALKTNKGLLYLDLFDSDCEDDGAIGLAEGLL